MIQNCASEIQNTVPNLSGNPDLRANFEILNCRKPGQQDLPEQEIMFGNRGNLDLLEQETNHIEIWCSLLSAWPAFGGP